MPSIILGTNKISKKYQKLIESDYLVLQQKILNRVKNGNNAAKSTKGYIPVCHSK